MRNAINNMDKYDTKFTILVGVNDTKSPLWDDPEFARL